MKNTFRISGGILLILTIFLTHSCKKDKPTPPIVTTTAVTEIFCTTVTSGGDVTNEGGAPIISRGVCWNTSAEPTIANSKTTEIGGLGVFTSILTQLTPNTLYYVSAYATNSAGTGYGNQVSFTTSTTSHTVPILTTTAITSIESTAAVSGGNISSDGGVSITIRGVCWGTSQNPTIADSKSADGTGTGVFTSSITGLTINTTYYVRAYATNSVGTAYGAQVSFTTLAFPVLTTTATSSITQTTATSGGNITSDGGATVTARGVCWSTSVNPTIADSKTTDRTGTGVFTSSITGLTAQTTYYVRAYATNSVGTSYGEEKTFTTYEANAISDSDGNYYNIITIGTQVWMKENLKTIKYNDGTAIPLVTDGVTWRALSTPGYCWYNNDAATYKATYGALYNWFTVNTGKLCPIGWHVPTDAEWTTLTDYLGGLSVAGGKLKEAGTIHWRSPNLGATNETGFTALAGGWRLIIGSFYMIGEVGHWWSSTESNTSSAWVRGMFYYYSNAERGYALKSSNGFSVRCVKD